MRTPPPHPISQVRFVYDCPDFEEFDIFERDPLTGAACLSDEGLRNADLHECMTKNAREDRFTLLAIPEETLELEALPGVETPRGAAQQTVRQRAKLSVETGIFNVIVSRMCRSSTSRPLR